MAVNFLFVFRWVQARHNAQLSYDCPLLLLLFRLFLLADQALIGYCKIIAEINRNKYVMRYRNEPRLTEKGKHEFKVLMLIVMICDVGGAVDW